MALRRSLINYNLLFKLVMESTAEDTTTIASDTNQNPK